MEIHTQPDSIQGQSCLPHTPVVIALPSSRGAVLEQMAHIPVFPFPYNRPQGNGKRFSELSVKPLQEDPVQGAPLSCVPVSGVGSPEPGRSAQFSDDNLCLYGSKDPRREQCHDWVRIRAHPQGNTGSVYRVSYPAGKQSQAAWKCFPSVISG